MRLPVVGIIILFALCILIDIGIYFDIRHSGRRGRHNWRRFYLGTALVCWLFMLVTVLLPYRSQGMDIVPMMWMLYAIISVYLAKLIYLLFALIGRLPHLAGKRGLRLGVRAGLPLAIIAFGLAWWGALVGRRQLEVIELDFPSKSLPEAFQGYKIVQFSDAHLGTWGKDTSFVSQMVDRINSLHPDAIVFTGDLVNRHSMEAAPFIKILSRLKAPDGVYAILGNHDYGDYMNWKQPAHRDNNNRLLAQMMRQMGWTLLNDSTVFLRRGNDSIALIGVENWGDPPFHTYGSLKRAYPLKGDSVGSLKDKRFKILLTHNPAHWEKEVTKISNIDLTLTGHTHAMQIMLRAGDWKWSPASWRYKYWGGLYEDDYNPELRLYVNIGCGEVGMPYRLGALPEITLFTLKN